MNAGSRPDCRTVHSKRKDMINCIYYNKLAFNCFPEAVLGKHMGNIKQQIGIVAFFGKHFSANKRQMTQRPDALTPDRHIKPRPTCSETVQRSTPKTVLAMIAS